MSDLQQLDRLHHRGCVEQEVEPITVSGPGYHKVHAPNALVPFMLEKVAARLLTKAHAALNLGLRRLVDAIRSRTDLARTTPSPGSENKRRKVIDTRDGAQAAAAEEAAAGFNLF